MFDWAYEIPNGQVGAILSGGSVVLMWVGIIFIDRSSGSYLRGRPTSMRSSATRYRPSPFSMAFCSA